MTRSTRAHHALSSRRDGAVVHLRIDDGVRNVLDLELVRALASNLEACRRDQQIRCVVIEGNEVALSVGLDTGTVLSGGEAAKELTGTMAKILRTLYLSDLVSVVVCSGHAVAAGAMLLLTADVRIGVEGAGRIGLSEVGVGLAVPRATQQLLRDRILPTHQYAAGALARLHDVETARRIGFFDELAPSLAAARRLASESARRLAELPVEAYLRTKVEMRAAFGEIVGD